MGAGGGADPSNVARSSILVGIAMGTTRLEAFSDGVIAVIITILVLEFKVPQGQDLTSLQELAPTFFSYLLSFVFVAIYWNNHHHMLHAVGRIGGAVLWANMHLLFWLSLVPFATAWMAERHFAQWPTLLYGVILLMAAVAYTLLQNSVIRIEGRESLLATAVGGDSKGKLSIIVYIAAIAAVFWNTALSLALYVCVAALWLVPDRRIERVIRE
jgi:uncharacterized membrane protein